MFSHFLLFGPDASKGDAGSINFRGSDVMRRDTVRILYSAHGGFVADFRYFRCYRIPTFDMCGIRVSLAAVAFAEFLASPDSAPPFSLR